MFLTKYDVAVDYMTNINLPYSAVCTSLLLPNIF